MDTVKEIEGSFSKLIPNKNGIPCDEKDSKKIRAEINRWKKDDRESRCTEFADLNYWQRASTCSAL